MNGRTAEFLRGGSGGAAGDIRQLDLLLHRERGTVAIAAESGAGRGGEGTARAQARRRRPRSHGRHQGRKNSRRAFS